MEEYLNIINSELIQYVKENPATTVVATICLGTFVGGIYHIIKKRILDRKERINELESNLRA